MSDPVRIPDERVPHILARAAEIDRATRESVDMDAIRSAALQAGISPAAVERALAEYSAGEIADPAGPAPSDEGRRDTPRWRRWARRALGPLKYGVGALLTGLFIAGAGEGAEPLVVLGWLGFTALSVRLAFLARPRRRARGFIARVALMAIGGALGLAMMNGDEDMIAGLLAFGGPLLVLGTAFIKVRRPRWLRSRAPRYPTLPAR